MIKNWTSTAQVITENRVIDPLIMDHELSQKLLGLARQENCSLNEIVSRLLQFALGEHKKIQYHSLQWRSLSAREQQVAACIRKGYSNQEIALQLGISTETVKTHVRNVLSKFGLRKKHDLRMELEGWDLGVWQR